MQLGAKEQGMQSLPFAHEEQVLGQHLGIIITHHNAPGVEVEVVVEGLFQNDCLAIVGQFAPALRLLGQEVGVELAG
jgi:hypothetical protein